MTNMGVRSAMAAGARFIGSRSLKTSSSTNVTPYSFFSSSRRPISSASRLASMLGMVESQRPLHTAIASARLTSILAVDTTCWSSLSRALQFGP